MFELLTDTPTATSPAPPSVRSEGYDAVKDKGRRQPPRSRLRSEDKTLVKRDRDKLVSTTRDLRRNFAIASWMIRKHLDYVASFSFQARTGDDGLDRDVEAFMRSWTMRERVDVARRHRFDRLIRLVEAMRCVDGDIGVYRLRNGRLQAIEGDRIRTARADVPTDVDLSQWTHGVRTGRGGDARAYMICRRARAGFAYQTILPARDVYLHGFFDRLDQVRGVSPLAGALNSLRDVYEGFDYALARMKVSQLFALAITSRTGEDDTPFMGLPAAEGEDADGEEVQEQEYEVDFGRGPLKLELEPGDDAKFLESSQPSREFQDFIEASLEAALKSLDIPYSFYDESHTNFFGSRGGLMHYIKSCRSKRRDVQELLNWITPWRLGMAIDEGEITLPRGMSFGDLRTEWIPDGVPWWDPAKEARGHAMAVAAGFDTFESVVRSTGGGTGDVFENIERNAEVVKFAREHDYPLTLPGASAFNPEPVAAGAGEEASDDDS